MAACDAKYTFTLVDIGDSSRQSDGSVYANSHLGYATENNLLGIPADSKRTNGDRVLPYVIVEDDASGLKRQMMKPYPSGNLDVPKQSFNYRLSQARRVIENAFGILASRFRVFHKPLIAQVHKVIAITKAAVALNNLLMHEKEQNGSDYYCPETFVDKEGPNGMQPGEWRQDTSHISGLPSISNLGTSNKYSKNAKWVRDEFKDYFNQEDEVDWQLGTVKRQ